MECPKDKCVLKKKLYESIVEVDECPLCQGLWLDAGELEKIQETIKNDYSDEFKKIPDYIGGAYTMAKAKQEGKRECPKCSKPMDKREYGYCSQIIVDVCPACGGIWLDKGELQNLEIFFERCRAETGEIRKGFLGSLIRFFK